MGPEFGGFSPKERVAFTRRSESLTMTTFDIRPVAVREYVRIRNGKPQVVKSHQRRRRNWRRYQ
jgi:hypothetical protein